MKDNKKLIPILIVLVVVAVGAFAYQFMNSGDGNYSSQVSREQPKLRKDATKVDPVPVENTIENFYGQQQGGAPSAVKGGR